jgi:hypothetical protein
LRSQPFLCIAAYALCSMQPKRCARRRFDQRGKAPANDRAQDDDCIIQKV